MSHENDQELYDGGIWLPHPEWLRPMDDSFEEEEEEPQDGIWLPSPDWLRPVEERDAEEDGDDNTKEKEEESQ